MPINFRRLFLVYMLNKLHSHNDHTGVTFSQKVCWALADLLAVQDGYFGQRVKEREILNKMLYTVLKFSVEQIVTCIIFKVFFFSIIKTQGAWNKVNLLNTSAEAWDKQKTGVLWILQTQSRL